MKIKTKSHGVLKLHEAIAVVLLGKKDRTASIEEIADTINNRKLYLRKDLHEVPPYQVMQRTKLSKGHYHHLFNYIEPNIVSLRDIH